MWYSENSLSYNYADGCHMFPQQKRKVNLHFCLLYRVNCALPHCMGIKVALDTVSFDCLGVEREEILIPKLRMLVY